MIRVFFAVLKDLWNFAIGAETKSQTERSFLPVSLKPMGANVAPPAVRERKSGLSETDVVGLRTAYISVAKAPCVTQPKSAFDLQISTFTYGERVGVRRIVDGFAEVGTVGVTGWVATDELTDDEHAVFPQFESGGIYPANHPELVKLRRYIDDECLGGALGMPLQSLEYVLYELRRRQVRFQWPSERPRAAGSAHSLLRGQAGVKMGIEPRTAAVFEGVAGGEEACFGMVETVHPDQRMTLASVGRLVEGEFRRETFTRDEWKEWRPTFLSFS